MNQKDSVTQPFVFQASINAPSILHDLGCTLAISTYQAGKVIFLSAPEYDKLVQLPRNFRKPMGIAVDGDYIAVATLGEILILKNSPLLAKNYPNQPETYDALYLPRQMIYTGLLDIHDLTWGKKGLWAVNTQFSCLCVMDGEHSFTPAWKPPFISKLSPHDRCHLNGMVLVDGEPLYATALSTTDEAEGWRSHKTTGGVLMHVPSNEIIASGLAMPHSPRVIDGQIYVLFSATGQLAHIEPESGQVDILCDLGGFARGMCQYGDYLFIGLSKIRATSKGFQDLPIAKKANTSGILIYSLKSHRVVGEILYTSSVDEIYDVQVIPDKMRPGIVTPEKQVHHFAITSTFGDFWKVPKGYEKK